MNDENIIEDFFKDVRQRGAAKAQKRADAEPQVDPVEENLFHASMGLGFRCGVCGTDHRSSLVEKVPSVKECIKRIVAKYGQAGTTGGKQFWTRSRYGTKFQKWSKVKVYTDKDVYNEVGARFLPSVDAPETLVLTYKESNRAHAFTPDNRLFRRMCPQFMAECAAETERFDQVARREVTDEVSIREALGAPSTFEYIEARREALLEHGRAVLQKVTDEHLAERVEFVKRARNWRKIPPEVALRWKVVSYKTGYEYPKWFQAWEVPKPVSRAEAFGSNVHAEDVLASFEMRGIGYAFLQKARTEDSLPVVFDLALVNCFPVLSWGRLYFSSYSSRNDKGKVAGVVHYLTTWSGKTFVNRSPDEGRWMVKSALAYPNALTEVGQTAGEVLESD